MPLGSFRLNGLSRRKAVTLRTAATISTTTSYTSAGGQFGGRWNSTTPFSVTVNAAPTSISNTQAGTIEWWGYRNTSGSSPTPVGGYADLGAIKVAFYGGEIYFEGPSYQFYGSLSSYSLGVWYHMAVQSQGNGTWQIYIDGVRRYNGTISGSPSIRTVDFFNSATGYRIDEIRFSKIARYGASYSVPTAAFVNDVNTQALFHCESSTEVDDRS